MKQAAKLKLLSINVKLFLWFWLIILITGLTTAFIVNHYSISQVVMPIHYDDNRILQHIQRGNNKGRFLKISHVMEQIVLPKKSKSLVIKNVKTGEFVSSNPTQSVFFLDYLAKANFQKRMTVRIPDGRITGPLKIVLEKQNYRVYITDKAPAPHMGLLYRELPVWLKVLIPFLVSLGLCWLLARSLSKPIYHIKYAAKQLGDGDFSVRVKDDTQRSDELGSLAHSFNQMAEKLELSVTAQQRLLGDVSHELRSPMTRLQLALGLAQKNINESAELNKHLVRCELEVERLDKMIGNVLSLSKLENSLYALNLETINLKELIELIAQDAQYLANDKSIKIELHNVTSAQIRGDMMLLTSVFNNILTNAVKYSEDNTTITLTQAIDDNVKFIVSDMGPGVPEKSLNKLFDPFYRVADARDRKTGGTGLGLAITKQAIVAHKGSVKAENNPDKGLRITIELPLKIT